MITIDKIKQLRDETGLSIGECQKALKEANGDLAMAKEVLRKKGKDFAKKRIEREAGQGIIESYIHSGKKVGAILELRCESDFAARSEDFKKLAHELCLQITAVSPEENELLEQPWIKDEGKKVKDLIEECISKLGENIIIKKFTRYQI